MAILSEFSSVIISHVKSNGIDKTVILLRPRLTTAMHRNFETHLSVAKVLESGDCERETIDFVG